MQKEIKRKCQGCMEIKDRTSLIKITKLQNGLLKINPNSKELGRSIYVCKNEACIKSLIKKKRIKNALKYSNMDEISRVEIELQTMF
ncbi:MAG: YlxR family protein [Candidatus Gastranaerophilales bacterium]|nr:YlxR family protein [Candidatus Gastranaerophilales bacterium]